MPETFCLALDLLFDPPCPFSTLTVAFVRPIHGHYKYNKSRTKKQIFLLRVLWKFKVTSPETEKSTVKSAENQGFIVQKGV